MKTFTRDKLTFPSWTETGEAAVRLKLKCDRIVVGDGYVDGFVYVEGGRIAAVTTADRPADEVRDFTGRILAPGFIDLHTHGGGGHAFMDSSPEAVLAGCAHHLRHGTTTILPTVSAGPIENMRRALADIDAARHSGRAGNRIHGAHLEGPYLSAVQCGAQCPDFITPPIPADYEALIADYGASIARWTYAPEADADGGFCRCLRAHGILASAGHTDAIYPDMQRAMAAGCSLVTHLYSCTSTVTRDHGFRRLGVIETAFLCDDLDVEIIADGKHLPPELIRMIVKIKGPEHVALVTDSLAIAGTDITEGVMSGTPFLVEDGVCKLRDRSAFAGSVATADRLVATLVHDCGIALPTAVRMMTETPARILGVDRGRIAPGLDADLVVFDDEVTVSAVFVGGREV